MADTLNLSIDERKIRGFIELEKKIQKLKTDKENVERAQQEAQGSANNARNAAIQGTAPWDVFGMAHAEATKLSVELEKLNTAQSAAVGDLQNARAVIVEEVIKAARKAVG